jgi:hypothetical protein
VSANSPVGEQLAREVLLRVCPDSESVTLKLIACCADIGASDLEAPICRARARYCLQRQQFGSACLWSSRVRDGPGLEAIAHAVIRSINGQSPASTAALTLHLFCRCRWTTSVAMPNCTVVAVGCLLYCTASLSVHRRLNAVLARACSSLVADALAILECTKCLFTPQVLYVSKQLHFAVLYVSSPVHKTIRRAPPLQMLCTHTGSTEFCTTARFRVAALLILAAPAVAVPSPLCTPAAPARFHCSARASRRAARREPLVAAGDR